jgi:Ca2+-binding RTX toxin-like protein
METRMPTSITDFLAAAAGIADALAAGATADDPEIVALLEDLATDFAPDTATGNDAANILNADASGNPLTVLDGRGGNDLLVGDASTDALFGGDGNDALTGGARRDGLFGLSGDDLLDAGRGFDIVSGGAGADILSGGAGNDTLDGGTGIDIITGGQGRDRVVFGDQAFESAAVIPGDGIRQVENTPDILTDWTIGEDRFLFDAEVFGVTGNKKVSVGAAEDIRSGANVIVITDTDNDGNAATAFNAAAAASLIAGNVDADGAGFFVYWNSALGINRLVYSENLNEATADLRVLGNINTLSGAEAIAALDDFSGRDFAFI